MHAHPCENSWVGMHRNVIRNMLCSAQRKLFMLRYRDLT